MNIRNLKAKSVSTHDFSMNPSPQIKRSAFPVRQGNTTAFSFSYLVPLYWYDVLPGDHWSCNVTASARTATPIAPILDNWNMEIFTFFVPYRLVWTNFVKMMGEQTNPGDSIAFTVPQTNSANGGYDVSSLADYFGLPTVGQVAPGNQIANSALPFRSYNLIIREWFRDENLQNAPTVPTGDGPDNYAANYGLTPRGKRPDYFTTALPWPQKGNTASTIPLGTSAPILTSSDTSLAPIQTNPVFNRNIITGTIGGATTLGHASSTTGFLSNTTDTPTLTGAGLYPSNLYADLSSATATTINQLRTAITLQQLLERDARGGTRYKEMIYSHFRVVSPDARLDRPEYIGGGTIPITVNAVPQTSATGVTGAPLGTLGGTGYAIGRAGFSYAATEHGCIICLVSARADLRYSQGVPRPWSKLTRYDFYLPVLDGLGEQPILNKEIYADGSANDDLVFGYGPRWDEYRHFPSRITGLMRPTASNNIAYWHSSEQFATLPALNGTFIQDPASTVLNRNFAAGSLSVNQQLFGDFMCQGKVARSMSTYGVPGLTRL